jgi:hypothetical protein
VALYASSNNIRNSGEAPLPCLILIFISLTKPFSTSPLRVFDAVDCFSFEISYISIFGNFLLF